MDISNNPVAAAAQSVTSSVSAGLSSLFGDDGLTFRDVLDLVNPLQHIPLVGNLYRRLTGDILDPAMRLAGGALFGGPIGAGLAAVTLAIKSFGDDDSGAVSPAPDGPAPGHHYEARGGWMVAASRAIQVSDGVPADSAVATREHSGAIARRRGGWMAQVYGPTATPEPVRRQIDTAA